MDATTTAAVLAILAVVWLFGAMLAVAPCVLSSRISQYQSSQRCREQGE